MPTVDREESSFCWTLDLAKPERVNHHIAEGDWFYENFIEWISSQGYHIELTGDEFEAAVMSDKLS